MAQHTHLAWAFEEERDYPRHERLTWVSFMHEGTGKNGESGRQLFYDNSGWYTQAPCGCRIEVAQAVWNQWRTQPDLRREIQRVRKEASCGVKS